MTLTGNCMNGRHHTCQGTGHLRPEREGGKDYTIPLQTYICECDCHTGGDFKKRINDILRGRGLEK